MESALHQSTLIVKKSSIHGYGVFAGQDIKKGDVIEECYSVLLEDAHNIKSFAFSANNQSAMVLGFGSIYNHSSFYENADYEFDAERSAMVFRALRDIDKGEEIFTSYGANWFASRQAKERKPSFGYRVRYFLKKRQILLRAVLVSGLLALIVYSSQLYLALY